MGKLTDITDLMVNGKEDFNCDLLGNSLIINDYFKVTEDAGQFYVFRLYDDKPEWKCKDAKSVVNIIKMNMPSAPGNRILNEIIASTEKRIQLEFQEVLQLYGELGPYDDDPCYWIEREAYMEAFIKIKALAKELGGE